MTDKVKEKLEKWGTGWRLASGVITLVVLITSWAVSQVYLLKIEIIESVGSVKLEIKDVKASVKLDMKDIKMKVEQVRSELLQSNLVYHGRVDNMKEKMGDMKEIHKSQWQAIRRLREGR